MSKVIQVRIQLCIKTTSLLYFLERMAKAAPVKEWNTLMKVFCSESKGQGNKNEILYNQRHGRRLLHETTTR